MFSVFVKNGLQQGLGLFVSAGEGQGGLDVNEGQTET